MSACNCMHDRRSSDSRGSRRGERSAGRRGEAARAGEREARLLRNSAAFERTAPIRVNLGADPVTILREGRDGGFERDREQLP